MLGLVGPNGSGKTTLLHVIAGLSAADDGRAIVCGCLAGSPAARASLAFVSDEPHGFDELTVRELAELLRSLYGVESGPWRARLAVMVDAFGLSSRLDSRIGSLSRGLRRQASMVAAFALATPLTLVDEATATLDPEATVVLRAIVRAGARRGNATLLATQDLAFAERACDCVVLLDRGTVAAVGSPDELRERYGCGRLEDVFLEAVGEADLGRRTERALAAL